MSVESTLIELNKKLLDAIMSGDWTTYADYCDPSITCFEPEALGHLVHGLDFHRFYFELGGAKGTPPQVTMCDPHVRVIGDAAIVTYIRLTQVAGPNGPSTSATEETRVWQKIGDSWKHVHFHRTPVAKT
ncbi:MAG: DUF4440 domain-containing protein [Planctomycetaceae bacterium]|nr:DUF4440 domain-containing protein [Planctomycetaceae bacterium]